jgi:hypothetical protein
MKVQGMYETKKTVMSSSESSCAQRTMRQLGMGLIS